MMIRKKVMAFKCGIRFKVKYENLRKIWEPILKKKRQSRDTAFGKLDRRADKNK
jgi:hypothetical protein